MNRLSLRSFGGARTLAGVVAFLLLSATAMTGIGLSVRSAARQDASALLYESAATRLQAVLLGLYEAALSDTNRTSLAVVKRELDQFQYLRHRSAELDADTRGEWPALDHRIDELLRDRGNDALASGARIELSLVTRAVQEIAARLDGQTKARRQGAAAAERGVYIVSIAAGAATLFGALGVFALLLRQATALQRAKKQLEEIADAVPALIAYVDTERRFRFHNKAYEEAFGLKPEQVQGRTLLEVFGDELYEAMRAKVDEVLSGNPVRFERTQVNVAGLVRDYAEHYFPRYSGDAKAGQVIGFYSLGTDITETKRIDRMKSEFVSTVSHELRTPLTSIRGSMGLLAGGVAGALSETAKSLVDIATNNCERLIRLINDILDTEKFEAGLMRFDLKVVDLQLLVTQTLAANEGFAAQHGVSLRLRAAHGTMRANVDADRLIQVVTNLLSNAVKFSPPQSEVEAILSRAAGRIRLEVCDRGPGIPEEFRSRIFQKFSQADSSDRREKGGTGLGLNISKAIVEGLGGTIGFSTEAGVGTSFFFEIPEWQGPPEPATSRLRILVCELDPDIGRLIGMMLDNAGYDTDLAGTAEQAREFAAGKSYAAMSVDLKLPNQHGVARIRALCEEALAQGLPMVAVSAYAENGRVRINSETLSASDWLAMPGDENRMVLAIRHAIEGGNREPPRPPAKPIETRVAQAA
jgi:PAS domain S-box-containing protein